MLGAVEQTGRQLAQMQAGTPEEKAQSQGMMYQLIGGALKGFGSEYVKRKKQGAERSREHGGEIQPAQEYASCGACGQTLTDLPPEGTEFRCPSCSEQLKV
jgi:hypothetical protein